MKAGIVLWVLAAIAAGPLPAASADWQAVEKVQTYAVTGTTGPELYDSIGHHGPQAGPLRAIAHTSFKLTWTRNYVPQPDKACMLVSAKPRLIITYVLPKPSQKLPPTIRANWQAFIDGVHKHERVHGDFITAMVKEIETVSVGLSAPDDPDCRKIRTELTRRLAAISQAQRQQSRDFDAVEMNRGGNVHQLILNLVNGG